MPLCNIGRTILDEVRLCYVAEKELRDYFSHIKKEKQEDGFCLKRTNISFYKHCFDIYWGALKDCSKPIAKLYFSHCNNKLDDMQEAEEINKKDYVFLKLENHVLYKNEYEVRKILEIPILYSMSLHHFTRFDLAKDKIMNFVKKLNGLMKRMDIGTIINTKWEDNHKKVLETVKEFRSRTLDKAIDAELIFMQANAVKNKNNGIIVSAYNKIAEIKNKQSNDIEYKQYILDYYGCPKKALHRLEVRVNASNITKYCEEKNIPITEDLLFNEALLTEMYFTFLSRVIRFSYVSTSKSGRRYMRKKIDWNDIFCNKKL